MSGLLGLGAAVWLFLFVLAVLWFFLPFAVFGSKPRLDKIIVELQTLNKTMKEISTQTVFYLLLTGITAWRRLEAQKGRPSKPMSGT